MEKYILEQLYKKYTKPLYLYLFSLCHNQEIAEDLMQETFLKAFCNLEHAKEEMLPWLFRVAKNMYIDCRRKEKCTVDYESVGEISAEDREILDQLIVKDQNRKLYKAICKLKEPDKEIVILYYFGGLSQNEIAKQLNLSAGNLRVILHRAKRKLYEDMKDDKR